MICYKFFGLSVVLLVLVTINLSFSQEVDEVPGVETTEEPATETEPPSTVICTTCVCADSVVNCTNLNISTSFELADWEGIATFNPIIVDLSGNPLVTITRFGKLPVQQLNLSNTQTERLEDAVFVYLEDLKSLDLSYNKISTTDLSRRVLNGPLTVDVGPTNFKQIEYVSLAYNDIHSLPQDVFTFLNTMKTLDLSGNPLAYIDQVTLGALTDLLNLRTLSLRECDLEALPEGLFRRQRKLKTLDLSLNRFTTIPSVLKEAPQLTYLNLDRNPIPSIEKDSAISGVTSLQELHLSRMSRLHNITAGGLGGLPNLVILKLAHNPRLTFLDPKFLVSEDEDEIEYWPPLKELYLNNNNLSTIDSHFLESWNDMEIGDFSNNPFVCDCNSQWMVDVLTPLVMYSPKNGTLKQMVCKKPADIRGMTYEQLYNASKTLVCAEAENITEVPIVSNLAIILGIMIGIIVTFPLVLVLVLLWKKGYFARCRERKDTYDDEENEEL